MRQDKNDQAYYQMELAAALDTSDSDYPSTLAGIIMDESIVRIDHACRSISKTERDLYVIPFIMRMMQANPSKDTLVECMDFLLRNRLKKYQEVFQEWATSGMEDHGIDGLNYEAADYIDYLSDHLDEEMCQQIEITE